MPIASETFAPRRRPPSRPARFPRRAARAVVVAVTALAVALLTGSSSGWAALVADDLPPGRWAPPLDGPPSVARAFDPPAVRWAAGHRGIDLRAAEGDEVLAVDAGVVVYAGVLAGVGVVSVQHGDGLRSTYQPVEPSVTTGDLVVRGQPIGLVVGDGSHCAPAVCLHLGARSGSTYLDPLLLLGLRPPRLLPYLDAGAMALFAPAPVADRAASAPLGDAGAAVTPHGNGPGAARLGDGAPTEPSLSFRAPRPPLGGSGAPLTGGPVGWLVRAASEMLAAVAGPRSPP